MYNSFLTTAEDLSDVFGKREVKQDKSKAVAVSQLSRQLEESLGKPNNPFLEYSKFEGEVRKSFENYSLVERNTLPLKLIIIKINPVPSYGY